MNLKIIVLIIIFIMQSNHCSEYPILNQIEDREVLPLEIQKIIFFFLPLHDIVNTTRLVSYIFNIFFQETDLYKTLVKKNVVADIRGSIFNKKMGEISQLYNILYKKYFPWYIVAERMNPVCVQGETWFEIVQSGYKKWQEKKIFQLLEVEINKEHSGGILLFREAPPFEDFILKEIKKVVSDGFKIENFKRAVFKGAWFRSVFKKIYTILCEIFPIKIIELPSLTLKNVVPKIVKKSSILKKIFIPGNMFLNDIRLCDDVRMIPSNIFDINIIKESYKDTLFPYFIHHNFGFDLLLEIIKNKNEVLLKDVKKNYNLTLDILSLSGQTLLQKVLPDRHLLSLILKEGGDINVVNGHSKTVFDKVILKLVDKHYSRDLKKYCESFIFLDLHGAQRCFTTFDQLQKAQKNFEKYFIHNEYEDILL